MTRTRLLGAALQFTIIDLIFSGLLLLFLLAGTAAWGRLLNNSILQFLGRISYGLYLVHLLVFRLYDKLGRKYFPEWLPVDGAFWRIPLRFVLAGGAAVLIAYLSRRFFEERFLRQKYRWIAERKPSSALSSVRLDDQLRPTT